MVLKVKFTNGDESYIECISVQYVQDEEALFYDYYLPGENKTFTNYFDLEDIAKYSVLF